MDILLSIRKPYTDYIFDGIKMLEFRNRIGKDVRPGDKILVYESKAGTGSGTVIGEVMIEDIIKISKIRSGTYFLLPFFVEKFGDEEEKAAVKKATSFQLSHYDMSVVLNYLFDERSLDYMIKNDEVPDPLSGPAFRGYTAKEFNHRMAKADKLCRRCDEWASKIGFYNEFDEAAWKYAIKLKNPVKYSQGLSINVFKGRSGKALERAPQSWCYVLPNT